MTDTKEKLKKKSMIIAKDLSIDLMKHLREKVSKIDSRILQLDEDENYAFTLNLISSFIKCIAYSIEIHSMMKEEKFEAEQVVEAVKSISLSLMSDKKEEFALIAKDIISKSKEKDHVK